MYIIQWLLQCCNIATVFLYSPDQKTQDKRGIYTQQEMLLCAMLYRCRIKRKEIVRKVFPQPRYTHFHLSGLTSQKKSQCTHKHTSLQLSKPSKITTYQKKLCRLFSVNWVKVGLVWCVMYASSEYWVTRRRRRRGKNCNSFCRRKSCIWMDYGSIQVSNLFFLSQRLLLTPLPLSLFCFLRKYRRERDENDVMAFHW